MTEKSVPRYSRRLAWDTGPNALAELLSAHRRAGKPLLNLTSSNPTTCGLPAPDEAIRWAFTGISSFAYQPLPEGLAVAREAVAGEYQRLGMEVNPSDLVLTASTSESYSFLFQLLCDPGDQVLAPTPSYPLFDFLARLAAVELCTYPLRQENGWAIDFAALEDAITHRTRAILVVNPNNPTGSYVDEFDAHALRRLCAERGIALIADEVFFEFPLRPGRNRASFAGPENDTLCFSLGGLSKSIGMPQMKLGWILVRGPHDERSRALRRLHLIADTFLSVSTPVQAALPQLLAAGARARAAIQQRIATNAATLAELPARFPHLTAPIPEGGWTALVRLPAVRTDEQWCEQLLTEQGVLVQPGYFYDFAGEAWIAVSLLTEPESFREGLNLIGLAVEKSGT